MINIYPSLRKKENETKPTTQSYWSPLNSFIHFAFFRCLEASSSSSQRISEIVAIYLYLAAVDHEAVRTAAQMKISMEDMLWTELCSLKTQLLKL